MRRVVVVGGGIVGAAIADGLVRHDWIEVTVLDRGPAERLLGSTGHAPGYVSLLSEAPVLSRLAIASANVYDSLGPGEAFVRTGGLEVATSVEAMANLERRERLAREIGMETRFLDSGETVAAAPLLVDREQCAGSLLFPADGAARGDLITGALRTRAEGAGALFLNDVAVAGFDIKGGRITAVRTQKGGRLEADDVVLSVGIWGREVAALAGEELVFAPVQHPYVYGSPREPSATRGPFAKWRGETVYARDHGDRVGIGTHDHSGAYAETTAMAEAELPWNADAFDDAVERAFALLPAEHRFEPADQLNGVFAMPPDNAPFVGPARSVERLWIAEALWVTHAAGGAAAIVNMLLGKPAGVEGIERLDPGRFAGEDPDELMARALGKYRQIWAPPTTTNVPR